MTRAVLALAALAACSTPPLTIELAIAGGSGQTCPSTSCSDIPMVCQAMVFVRILDPNNPDEPYLSQCLPVLQTGRENLCPVAGIQLSPDDSNGHPIVLPEQTLEVQVVVLPFSAGSDGLPACDADVTGLHFAATGVPEADASSPPVGGRAFYHPGDKVTVVELGCNDLAPLNDGSGCAVSDKLEVDATVVDFPTELPVTATVAQDLTVSVGEPIPKPGAVGDEYVLEPSGSDAAHPLALTATEPTPAWSTTIAETFDLATCIEVLESGAETTATLSCHAPVPGASSLDFDGKALPAGIHLPKPTLDALISALADKTFTLDHGLVLGIVLDGNGSPVVGQSVTGAGPVGMNLPTPTVHYLSADSTSFTGTATSATGIFASTDADFLTTWTTTLPNMTATTTAFGGLVDGMVTIVVLQFPPNTHT